MWPRACVCVGRRQFIYVVRSLEHLWNGEGGGKCSKRGKIFLARTVSVAISWRTSKLLLCRRVIKPNAQWSNDGFVHECDKSTLICNLYYAIHCRETGLPYGWFDVDYRERPRIEQVSIRLYIYIAIRCLCSLGRVFLARKLRSDDWVRPIRDVLHSAHRVHCSYYRMLNGSLWLTTTSM